MTWTKCTLQVVEFMSDHPLNPQGGCFYHHCADISIEPGGDGGKTFETSDGGSDASSGGGGASNPSGSGNGSGCGCELVGGRGTAAAGLASLAALMACAARR